jgi:hypothetical protein
MYPYLYVAGTIKRCVCMALGSLAPALLVSYRKPERAIPMHLHGCSRLASCAPSRVL